MRQAGALGRDGAVVGFAVETPRTTLISSVARLRLTYTGDAGKSPSHLFFKGRRADLDEALGASGRRECAFYSTVAAVSPPGLLPRCYEASAPPEGAWHPRLGVSVGVFLDTSGALDGHLARFAKDDFSTFVDRLGDRLSPERRAVYEGLLATAPRLLARYRSHRDLTIVHGDAHMWNVMLPRDRADTALRLIDWDAWHIDVATDDLAYMMALYWTPERRRRLERHSLERYHATLLAHGVNGYDFDALWRDYRESVLWQITTPVRQATHKLAPVIWWNNLEHVMLAIDDLACREFLA